MNDLIEEISSQLLTRTGHLNAAVTRRDWFLKSDLNKKIIEATSFLPETSTYTERYFCIKNNITSRQICHITGKPLRFLPTSRRYAKVSGKENSHYIIDLVIRNQNLSKNKLENNKKSRQNIIQKFLDKQYILQSKEIVQGFINVRRKETKNKAYINNTHLIQNIDILCSLLYYTHHILFEPFTIESEISWCERFYIFTYNIPPMAYYNDPYKKAPFENFNIGYRRQTINSPIKNLISNILPNNIEKQGFEILNDSFRTLRDTIFTIKCKKCGVIQEKRLTNARWKDIYCPGCYGDMGYSKLEKEVVIFLENNNIKLETNKKDIINSGELDIYIPSKNLAIEFDGVLWHSFGNTFPNNADIESKNKNRHVNKTIECKNKNIQLLHIFDSEWNIKQDIVKSIILSKLGIYKERIYARKCIIDNVNRNLTNKFLIENHMQGICSSSYNYGLFYNKELISLMTFGIRKITGAAPKMELLRFCNKLNTQIIGGASKLFQHFIKNIKPENILSYADKRFSNGSLYYKLGFTLSHESQPNYWYTNDCQNLIHRSKFQKHKICLTESDQQKTESEIMYERGYRRIYDCGSFVFEWKPQLNNSI